MAQVAAYNCDVCGIQKKESNHWWYVRTIPDSELEVNSYWQIMPWDYPAENPEVVHLCGVSCAIRHLSAFLEGGRKPAAEETQKVYKFEKDSPH